MTIQYAVICTHIHKQTKTIPHAHLLLHNTSTYIYVFVPSTPHRATRSVTDCLCTVLTDRSVNESSNYGRLVTRVTGKGSCPPYHPPAYSWGRGVEVDLEVHQDMPGSCHPVLAAVMQPTCSLVRVLQSPAVL